MAATLTSGTAVGDPPPWDKCGAGAIAIFDGPGGTGLHDIIHETPDLNEYGMDNKSVSVCNLDDNSWQLYPDPNYQGDYTSILPGYKVTLAPDDPQYRQISSVKESPPLPQGADVGKTVGCPVASSNVTECRW